MVKIQDTVLHPTHPEMVGEDLLGIEMDLLVLCKNFIWVMNTLDHPIVNNNSTVSVVSGFLDNAKNVVDYVKEVKPEAFFFLEVTTMNETLLKIQNCVHHRSHLG